MSKIPLSSFMLSEILDGRLEKQIILNFKLHALPRSMMDSQCWAPFHLEHSPVFCVSTLSALPAVCHLLMPPLAFHLHSEFLSSLHYLSLPHLPGAPTGLPRNFTPWTRRLLLLLPLSERPLLSSPFRPLRESSELALVSPLWQIPEELG